MPFYQVLQGTEDEDKRVLLSESLSLLKVVNLVSPLEIIIGGILEPATVAASGILISTDGENWTDVINTIDFRIEFEPRIFIAPDEQSNSGTIQILLASSAK